MSESINPQLRLPPAPVKIESEEPDRFAKSESYIEYFVNNVLFKPPNSQNQSEDKYNISDIFDGKDSYLDRDGDKILDKAFKDPILMTIQPQMPPEGYMGSTEQILKTELYDRTNIDNRYNVYKQNNLAKYIAGEDGKITESDIKSIDKNKDGEISQSEIDAVKTEMKDSSYQNKLQKPVKK